MAEDIQRDAQQAATQDRAFEEQIKGRLVNLHTCLPGIIASYDPATQTAEVQPAIKRKFTDRGFVNLPLCVDVPVAFPGGGDFFLTFPVKPGDECLLLFSERAIDNWFAQGGTAEPAEARMHDLSDGLAIVGLNSQPRAIPACSATDTELRSRDGETRITVKPDGTIEQHNSGGTVTQQPGGKLIIDMPEVEMTGTLKVAGLITGQAGLSVSGGGGVVMTGTVTTNGSLINNGVNVGSTHTHGGVEPGAGNTNTPNP